MNLKQILYARMSRFTIAVAMCCVLFLAQTASAAVLPFEITVLQGDSSAALAAEHKGSSPREVMFLVLDHSGSMNDRDNRSNTRWEALLDSLKLTLSSLRPGTEVRIEWIESLWETNWRGKAIRRLPNRSAIGPVILSNADSWKTVWSRVEKVGAPDNAGTPLFESLENVSNVARDLVCRGSRVAVVVFSDGDSNEPDKEIRRKRLDDDFSSLFEDSRFKTCLVWINPSKAPPEERLMGVKWNLGYQAPPAIYSSTAEPMSVAVENPISGGKKPGTFSLAFFVPPDVWKKMDGKRAQISVMSRGAGNAVVPVGTATVAIRRGVQNCRIEVPNSVLSASAKSSLSLEVSSIPSPEGALVSPPQSIGLLIVEPDKLSISSVFPAQGTVVREGEEIAFAVTATPGANCKWTFGDGYSSAIATNRHAYAHEGYYEAKVVVSKEGYAPREGLVETRKIEVVHTEVILGPIGKIVRGRVANFSCKGIGPVSGYVWLIDGEKVLGVDSVDKKSSSVSYSFPSAGPHTIQVRANMNRLGSVLSEKKSFDVGAAPYLKILKPIAGTSFSVGEQIPFLAQVDGGVSGTQWRIFDTSGAEVSSIAANVNGVESKSVMSFDSPGEYVARVFDSAGIAEKSEVTFFVRPKDVSLTISEPENGSRIETGEHKTVTLRASVKGLDKVSWFVRNDDTGKEMALGESQVGADGYAALAWPVPPTGGDGARTVIARNSESDFEAVPVKVELYTVGAVKILDPIDYFRAPFGTNVTLRAEVSGAATDVRWFIDGEELKAKGEMASFETGLARSPERLFRVQARVAMPGGGSLVTPERTVVAYCPDVKCSIGLPRAEGVMRTSFGRAESFDVQLEDENGRPLDDLTDVKWNFGDGTTADKPVSHRPAYGKYGEFTIKASGKCPKCGTRYDATPVKIKIEKQQAVAKFKMEPELSAYTIRGNVRLIDISEGDVGKRVWRVNGTEIKDSENKKEVNDGLPSIPEDRTYTLEVTDMDGKVSEPYVVTIRVRYGWLAVFFFIGAGLIILFAKKVLLGNELLDMTIKALIGPRPNTSLDDLLAEVASPNVSEFSVKEHLNFWQKIVWMIVSKKPKSLTVAITDLLASNDEDAARCFGDERLTFSVVNDVPEVRYNEHRFEYVTPMAWNHRSPYGEDDPSARIRVLKDRSCTDDSRSCLYLLMRLEDSRHWSVIAFWVIVITMIYLVFHLCMRYAI